jgi:hypothetical protein
LKPAPKTCLQIINRCLRELAIDTLLAASFK